MNQADHLKLGQYHRPLQFLLVESLLELEGKLPFIPKKRKKVSELQEKEKRIVRGVFSCPSVLEPTRD